MQAWLLDQSPGAYRYGEVDLPEPGPGEVWARVVTSALNHLDLWMRKAMPKPPLFPMVPGCDGAGTVDAVGEGVTLWRVGDEVIINPSFACGRCLQCLSDRSVFCPKFGIMGEHYWGAHGELVVVREANLVAKPPALSWEAASAYPLCGLTVYRMLQRARLAAGETLLVVGAGGGVGSAALAIGQQMGARVYVTSRDPAKRAHALELGALGAFPSDEKVPLKADVVVDTVGSPTWAFSMGALVPGGRLVTCGGTGGGKVELNVAKLFFGQYEIMGSTMGTFREFEELTRLVTAGLPVQVDSVYPLADYPSALDRMEAGAQFGKVVLRHQ
jgi:zinc-binding alcohol dehydrogenase/oxidoreductase